MRGNSSKGVSNNYFELRFVDEEFIYDELRSLNIHKAVGLDEIAPRVLRDGAKQLRPLITHIVNLSIESSTVPQDLYWDFLFLSVHQKFSVIPFILRYVLSAGLKALKRRGGMKGLLVRFGVNEKEEAYTYPLVTKS